MKVLITGGAGFIGSHLCKFLLEENGDEVIVLDNFFTGNRKNLESIVENPNLKVIEHDITEPLNKDEIGDIDKIYNLACPASPIHYQFDPIETIKANTLGVINVLEFAKLTGATILQASTSEVYGDPLEHPQRESYWGNVNMLGPRACYDEGKRIAESLFIEYNRKYKIPIKIARIFNSYGPNMDKDDGRVVSNFIMQALENKPITVYGSGNQTRCFCYVCDMVKGLYYLMESDEMGPINLGNPEEITILKLAKKIIKNICSESEIIFRPLPVNDPSRRKPDINLAKSKLGWEPMISLDEGLNQTINYFKNTLKYSTTSKNDTTI